MEAFTDNSSLQSNTNNSDLKSQTDIHTVEISYKCDQCDLIFMGSKAGHQEEAIVVCVDDDVGRGVTGRAQQMTPRPPPTHSGSTQEAGNLVRGSYM